MPKGKDHYKYKEKIIDKDGYIDIHLPEHPFANAIGCYPEHRDVYERTLNCILLPYTQLHHNDHNKQNNSFENLTPCYNGQHISKYHIKDKSNWYCSLCNKKTYVNKDGKEYWYYIDNKRLCRKCIRKINYDKDARRKRYLKEKRY